MTMEWRCLAVSLTEAAADTLDIVKEPTCSTWKQKTCNRIRNKCYRIRNTYYRLQCIHK